jgi:hypothetical protein
MDHLMKLVVAALHWSYEAKATDVQEKWLEQAAELLVLRHDTFEIIDGKGPGAETEQVPVTEKEAASQIPAVPVSSPNEEQELPPSVPTEQTMQTPSRKKEEAQPAALGNCTLGGGVLRFKSHKKRKTNTPNTGRRWARMASDWSVVGS